MADKKAEKAEEKKVRATPAKMTAWIGRWVKCDDCTEKAHGAATPTPPAETCEPGDCVEPACVLRFDVLAVAASAADKDINAVIKGLPYGKYTVLVGRCADKNKTRVVRDCIK